MATAAASAAGGRGRRPAAAAAAGAASVASEPAALAAAAAAATAAPALPPTVPAAAAGGVFRVVFVAFGTRGDVQPLLAVASYWALHGGLRAPNPYTAVAAATATAAGAVSAAPAAASASGAGIAPPPPALEVVFATHRELHASMLLPLAGARHAPAMTFRVIRSSCFRRAVTAADVVGGSAQEDKEEAGDDDDEGGSGGGGGWDEQAEARALERADTLSACADADLIVCNLFALRTVWHVADAVGSGPHGVPRVCLSPYPVPSQHAPQGFARMFQRTQPALYKQLVAAADARHATTTASSAAAAAAAPWRVSWEEVTHWLWPVFADALNEDDEGGVGAYRERHLTLSRTPLLVPETDAPPRVVDGGLPEAPHLMYGVSPAVWARPGFWSSPPPPTDTTDSEADAPVSMTGFWLTKTASSSDANQQAAAAAYVPPPAVAQFLARNRDPDAPEQSDVLYVGFGSMGAAGLLAPALALRLTKALLRACASLKLRIVVSASPFATAVTESDTVDVGVSPDDDGDGSSDGMTAVKEQQTAAVAVGSKRKVQAQRRGGGGGSKRARRHADEEMDAAAAEAAAVSSTASRPGKSKTNKTKPAAAAAAAGAGATPRRAAVTKFAAADRSALALWYDAEPSGRVLVLRDEHGDIPHSWLFPLCCGVVHHGGSGTTASALVAGVPQLLVPFMFDQQLWAQLAERQCVGPAPLKLPRAGAAAAVDSDDPLSDALVTARIKQLVDPALRANAQVLAKQIASEPDGCAVAVSRLNRIVARHLPAWQKQTDGGRKPRRVGVYGHVRPPVLMELAAPPPPAGAAPAAAAVATNERRSLALPFRVYALSPSETVFLHDEIFVRQLYLSQQYGITLPARDAVVVDVGANIGLFSLFVTAQSPGARIVACEPLPPCIDAAKRNFQLHGVALLPCPPDDDAKAKAKAAETRVDDTASAVQQRTAEHHQPPPAASSSSSSWHGVHLHAVGLTDAAGVSAAAAASGDGLATTTFVYLPNAAGNSHRDCHGAEKRAQLNSIGGGAGSADEESWLLAGATVHRAPVTTLSRVLRAYQRNGSGDGGRWTLPHIDLLKVDVEGDELRALQGLECDEHWRLIHAVSLEVHDVDGRRRASIIELLTSKGFDRVHCVDMSAHSSDDNWHVYASRSTSERRPAAAAAARS